MCRAPKGAAAADSLGAQGGAEGPARMLGVPLASFPEITLLNLMFSQMCLLVAFHSMS